MNNSKLVYLDNAATSLKTFTFIDKLCESFDSHEWYDKRFQSLNLLLQQLSEYFSVNVSSISIVPSSSYAINEIWSFILDRDKTQENSTERNIYICKEEHISNFSSIIHWLEKEQHKNIKLNYFCREELENIYLKNNDVILLTIVDNLGLNCFSIEEIQRLRRRSSKSIIIGDLTQYIPHAGKNNEMYSLFDFCYFSAHKYFGPFGLGVLVSKEIGLPQEIKLRSNYQLDWRSVWIWSETFREAIELQDIKREKELKLKKYWIENFPSELSSFSYFVSEYVPIFLVGLDSQHLHDFIFLLESRNIIFRAYDFCSFSSKIDRKQIRFSLSHLNTVEDIDRLFAAMRFFSKLKL